MSTKQEKELAFRSFEKPKLGRIYHFYISGIIGEPKDYIDLIHTIRDATSVDHIYLHLNTPGGQAFTGVQIIHAIHESDAHVITCMEGQVSSMGSMIFLAGKEYVVHDYSIMLIHNHSGGQKGKGHEYLAQAQAMSAWFENIVKRIYKHFLTDAEIKHVLDGKDFWFDSDEVRKRIKKMVKLLSKEQKGNENETTIGE